MAGEPMIAVRELAKSFGAVAAVRGISFSVARGEIVGFLGPNGAGKTTTLRMLAGVFPPTSGVLQIAGRDPACDPLACRRAVGYFPEYAPFYPELRLVAYLRFVARLKRVPRRDRRAAVDAVLAACGLETVAGRRIGTLSKGYRQRVGLAQALCGDPPILILDEPTIGLDPAQMVEMRELIRALRGQRTVVFSSHILSEVEALCDRVIVIAGGRIVGEGSPGELSGRLGGRPRIVLRVAGPDEEVGRALAALPAVERVERANGTFVLTGAGAGDAARAAGEAMHARGWPVLELRQETPDLEEVFLRLVREDRLGS